MGKLFFVFLMFLFFYCVLSEGEKDKTPSNSQSVEIKYGGPLPNIETTTEQESTTTESEPTTEP